MTDTSEGEASTVYAVEEKAVCRDSGRDALVEEKGEFMSRNHAKFVIFGLNAFSGIYRGIGMVCRIVCAAGSDVGPAGGYYSGISCGQGQYGVVRPGENTGGVAASGCADARFGTRSYRDMRYGSDRLRLFVGCPPS